MSTDSPGHPSRIDVFTEKCILCYVGGWRNSSEGIASFKFSGSLPTWDHFVSSVNVSNTLVQAEIITHIGFEGLISAEQLQSSDSCGWSLDYSLKLHSFVETLGIG